MSPREMQIEFEIRLKTLDNRYELTEKLDSDTIFYWLNTAQFKFINLNYINSDNLTETVDNLRKNIDVFKSIIVEKELVDTAIKTDNNRKIYRLPTSAYDSLNNEEFYLYIDSVSYVSGTYMNIPDTITVNNVVVDNKKPVQNKLVKNSILEGLLPTYYNSPILRQPCAVLNSQIGEVVDNLEVCGDEYTKIKGCKLTYIRSPRTFALSVPQGSTSIVDRCELSDNVHKDIVELAVAMFVENATAAKDNKSKQQ